MISGTIVLEDMVITFTKQGNNIFYTTINSVTGTQETKTVPSKKFRLYLGIVIGGNSILLGKEGYNLADNVQSNNP